MTTGYKQPGSVLTLAAPYNRNSGEGAKVGAIFGVAMSDVTSGDDGQFKTDGVHELTKATGIAWAQGDPLFWDDSAKKVTGDSAAGMLVGAAVEAAASGDTSGIVKLNGSSPSDLEGAQAAIASLTGAGGGTANGSLVDEGTLATAGGNTYTDAAVNTVIGKVKDNIAEIAAKQQAILVALRAAGIIDP